MDAGSQNEKMSAMLIEHLIACGVEDFCLSPGSRSTPLALAVAENPRAKARARVHYDERGMAFYALGIAKGSRRSVALITTSGTAVANMLPAVVEASNDHVPLIVITADRPQELRDCSANQTIDQIKLFNNFARFQSDLALSDPGYPLTSFATLIAHAVLLSQSPCPGPVHLNCQFREPLFGSAALAREATLPRVFQKSIAHPPLEALTHFAERSEHKKGLIIAGALSHDFECNALFALAEKLQWPIYADILSQLRSHKHAHLLSHFDPLIEAGHSLSINAVIHFGGRTVSKGVSQWLKKQHLDFYLHISDFPTLMDPHALITHRLQGDAAACAECLSRSIAFTPDPQWMHSWKETHDAVTETLSHYFSQHPEISEPGAIRILAEHLSDETAVFLANSMPVRDADKFYAPIRCGAAFFGNRGVSGIDGNIATAAGIAQGSRKPLIAVLGDLAFLHDVNSLALLGDADYPICLLVINNSGGGIFSFLPASEKKQAFEQFFAAAHPFTFSHAAQLFQLRFAQPTTSSELGEVLTRFVKERRSILIEVGTEREQNVLVHREIAKAVKNGVLHATAALC